MAVEYSKEVDRLEYPRRACHTLPWMRGLHRHTIQFTTPSQPLSLGPDCFIDTLPRTRELHIHTQCDSRRLFSQIEQLKLAVEYAKKGGKGENAAECAGREGVERLAKATLAQVTSTHFHYRGTSLIRNRPPP